MCDAGDAVPFGVGQTGHRHQHQDEHQQLQDRTKNREAVYSLCTTSSLYPFLYSTPVSLLQETIPPRSVYELEISYQRGLDPLCITTGRLIEEELSRDRSTNSPASPTTIKIFTHSLSKHRKTTHTYLPTNADHNNPHNGATRPHLPPTRGRTYRAV